VVSQAHLQPIFFSVKILVNYTNKTHFLILIKKHSYDLKKLTKIISYFFKIRDQIRIKKDYKTNLIFSNENIN